MDVAFDRDRQLLGLQLDLDFAAGRQKLVAGVAVGDALPLEVVGDAGRILGDEKLSLADDESVRNELAQFG